MYNLLNKSQLTLLFNYRVYIGNRNRCAYEISAVCCKNSAEADCDSVETACLCCLHKCTLLQHNSCSEFANNQQ